MTENFEKFLADVDPRYQEFVKELDALLAENGCKCDIKMAKTGWVVSYVRAKRTLATYVFRKSGAKLRIFPEHVASYQEFLGTLPEKFKKDIEKASDCKRLLNPTDCNSRCKMGFTFELDGRLCKKCRFSAFMPSLSEENNPFIRRFIEKELACCEK